MTTKILLCICCAVALANGDESGCRDFWYHKDGKGEAHPDGLLGRLAGQHACVTEVGDYFTRETCDGCGDNTFGERLNGAIL